MADGYAMDIGQLVQKTGSRYYKAVSMFLINYDEDPVQSTNNDANSTKPNNQSKKIVRPTQRKLKKNIESQVAPAQGNRKVRLAVNTHAQKPSKGLTGTVLRTAADKPQEQSSLLTSSTIVNGNIEMDSKPIAEKR